MSMESLTKPQGVPVSAATPRGVPLLSSSLSGSSSSFPIRAPLTVDSDDSFSSYNSSDNGFESDGVLSDEEVKFDNVPVVAIPDDENSGDEVVSKPFVTHPNENISQEKETSSSTVEKNVVSGLYVSIPDRIMTMNRVVSRRFLAVDGESLASPLLVKEEEGGKDVAGEAKMVDEEFVVSRPNEEISGSSYVEKKVVSVPDVSIPDRVMTMNRVVSRRFLGVNGESLVSPLVEEEDSSKDLGGESETKMVDDINLSLPSPGMPPVAKLSRDSDEDSVGRVFEEDDGVPGVATIPVIETLEKLSTLKSQPVGVGEGGVDEDESQFKSILESEVFEGSVSSEHLNGVLGGAEDMSIVEKDSLKDNIIAGLVKDEGPHVAGDAKATSLVESDVSFLSNSSELDEAAEYSVKEIHGLENMEQVAELDDTNSMNTGYNASVECTSTTQGETAVDSIESKEVVEGSQIEDAGSDELSSVIYFPIDSSFLEADKVADSMVEIESVNMTGLGANVVETVDEKNVSETQAQEAHKPGGDIAIECDIKHSVYEENAEVDQDVKVDAICVYNHNCETNGGHVNGSEIFSLESKSEKVEHIMEQDTDFLNGQIHRSIDGGIIEDELCCKSSIHQHSSLGSDSDHLEVEYKIEVSRDFVRSKEEEKDSCSEYCVEGLMLGESKTVENIASEMELVFSSDSFSGGESSHDHSKMIDEHIVTYSDEDADPVRESEGEVLFDSAAFSGLPDIARDSESDNSVTITSSADDSGILSLKHSTDLNFSISSTELTAQTDHPIISTSTKLDPKKIFAEEEKNKLDVQQIRVKYLRLVQRLGLSAEDSIAAQVLYLLDLAMGRSSSLGFSEETAKRAAVQFEADNEKDLDFSLNILIIGKSGVGKSATINSIFGEEKTIIDPFEPATTAVKEIVGTIDGIKVRVLDTPGLRSSLKDQSLNRKILKSIGKFTKYCPPDVVIYVDRLDIQSQDHNDLPLLRSITSSLGSSIWHRTFITLTHAASTPPDGPTGEPLSYEKFVALRSHVIQQLISHAIGDQNMVNAGLVNPVCLVENQGFCKKSRGGQCLLPNGEAWKPQLLLLCCSVKILSELDSTIKAYKTLDVNKLFDFLVPSPPFPYFLSSLLQSCDHLEFSADQGVENLDSDIEMGGSSDLHQKDEEDYDHLPPFKLLTKSQIANLSKEQRKAYFEGYDYHVRLIQKKQWREGVKRSREINKNANKAAVGASVTFSGENMFSGIKLEDEIAVEKRLVLVGILGAIQSQGNAAYKTKFKVRFRGNEYPVEHDQTTMTLALMRRGGDRIWGCNLQSRFSIGDNTKIVMCAGIDNKKSGQVSVRISSSEQLQIALVVLIPIVRSICSNFFPSLGKDY